jgi:putative membrane protein
MTRTLLSSLLALSLAGPVAAQATGAGPSGTAGSTGTADKAAAQSGTCQLAAFLKQAAQNGLAEVEGSKLALTKAQNTQVKAFAQQMVDDHGKANEELKTLASAKGVELPAEPSVAQKAKMKSLHTADGADFDRRYADTLGVAAHEDTVKLFQKASTGAADPQVKAFATKTLPTLQHHLQMAKDMKAATSKEGDVSASGTGQAKGKAKP